MLSILPQIAKVGIELASKQASRKEETDTDSDRAKDRGKAKKARCPLTDADNKHSIDQTPGSLKWVVQCDRSGCRVSKLDLRRRLTMRRSHWIWLLFTAKGALPIR
jgi:hypothetical protein